MDRTILINMNGSYIRKDNSVAGVQGEGNSTVMNIVFDESWADFTKKVTFWNSKGLNPVEVTLGADLLTDITTSLLNYSVPIPSEPMEFSGEMTFVIDGYVDGVRRRSLSDTLDVKYAPIAENAGNAVEPTPSTIEQMQGQIDSLLGDIQAERILSQEAAETATSSAETVVSATAIATNAANVASESATSASASETNAEKSAKEAQRWAEQAEAFVQGDFVTTLEFEETISDVGDAIAENSNAISNLQEQAKNYVQKEEGKGLSTNDYTDEAVEEVGKIADKENKASFNIYTILTSGWTDNTYSLEAEYPSETYDVFIYPSKDCTIEQYGAFGSAAIASDKDNNVLTALGTVPTIDIPVIAKVVKK